MRGLLLVGLAPAAHGANRTGRVFTGDGVGGSGDFLMSALHRTGFANITTSRHIDDGLTLTDAYIVAAVRCAPPDNKPLPEEITRCLDHLEAEVTRAAARPRRRRARQDRVRCVAAAAAAPRRRVAPRPQFAHGAVVKMSDGPGGPHRLIGCYHPSRQNTQHGEADGADDGGRVQEGEEVIDVGATCYVAPYGRSAN